METKVLFKTVKQNFIKYIWVLDFAPLKFVSYLCTFLQQYRQLFQSFGLAITKIEGPQIETSPYEIFTKPHSHFYCQSDCLTSGYFHVGML